MTTTGSMRAKLQKLKDNIKLIGISLNFWLLLNYLEMVVDCTDNHILNPWRLQKLEEICFIWICKYMIIESRLIGDPYACWLCKFSFSGIFYALKAKEIRRDLIFCFNWIINLIMSFCTIFLYVILGWYHHNLLMKIK